MKKKYQRDTISTDQYNYAVMSLC